MIETKEPKLLWQHFAKMSAIPRASKKEEKIRQHYIDYAKTKGFEYKEDEIGNILIKKPATKGYENAPKIILQGHMDMVCQKDSESTHNFDQDPIRLLIDGDWLKADGTTLGADNGIGISAAMAILDDESATHGSLEILLTVDEEAGMGGVRNLKPNWLEGDYLLNLDSERFGSCCVGCAGGADITLEKELQFEATPQGEYFKIEVSGLRGGHSGINIKDELGSASQLLAEFLNTFSQNYAIRLSFFYGGTLRNAITRDAYAIVSVDKSHVAPLNALIEMWRVSLKERLQKVDEGVTISINSISKQRSLDLVSSRTILTLLTLLPHGVIRQSPLLPVVETSCNIGTVRISEEEGLHIGLLARSLNENGLETIILRVKSLAVLADAMVEVSSSYPSWKPNLESKPLKMLQETYRELFQNEIDIEVIHAGLETGLLGEYYPHLQMVSFGPTIRGAHSPDEMVSISSVVNFYNLLKALLANMKK